MDQEIKDLYEQGISGIEIAKIFNIKPHVIYYKLKKLTVVTRSNKINSRKYNINHNFFSTIDTEEKAYWLGFLGADGFIETKNPKLGCSLSRKDRSHLEKLSLALDSDYPIWDYLVSKGYKTGTEYSRFLITSKPIYEDLISLGFTSNKSYNFKFPVLPSELEHHFIRGYFDGDGSWARTNRKLPIAFKLLGTEDFLNEVKLRLNLTNKLYKTKSQKTFSLEKTGQDIIRLVNYLYKDSTIFLERKYNKVKQFHCPLI